MNILIVDDEYWMRRTLKAMLNKWGYDVLEAADGEQAWSLFMRERERIGMLICDWSMPNLNGLELCRRLRAADFESYVYFILLTGKDQTEDTFTAFEAGADDFANKPINAKELQVRINAGERILRLEQALKAKNAELHRLNTVLESNQIRIRNDLEAAAAIQQSLLPASAKTGLPLKLAWAMVPADELAGDIFNFFRLDERRLAFYLIDVSGHGVRAAMFSVHLSQLLSPQPTSGALARLTPFGAQLHDSLTSAQSETESPNDEQQTDPLASFTDPVDVVTRLNQGFQVHDRNMIYFTMIYGVIDAITGAGSLCQAGHPYPLLCRRSDRVEILGEGGLPVGLVPDACYEAVKFKLEPGDRLLLYSDGVTECFSPDRTPFGLERLAEEMRLSRGTGLDDSIIRIERALNRWRDPSRGDNDQSRGDNGSFSDDLSMLAIELDPL